VARGGRATVEGIRLLCRAHNQYEAERVFGAGFMDEKREQVRAAKDVRARAAKPLPAPEAQTPPGVNGGGEARGVVSTRVGPEARADTLEDAAQTTRAATEARTEAETRAAEEARRAEEARAIAKQHAQDVLAGLRGLGVRAELARRAAEFSETLRNATLEERMRAALKFVRPAARCESYTGDGAAAAT
jgi:hypothetical protein